MERKGFESIIQDHNRGIWITTVGWARVPDSDQGEVGMPSIYLIIIINLETCSLADFVILLVFVYCFKYRFHERWLFVSDSAAESMCINYWVYYGLNVVFVCFHFTSHYLISIIQTWLRGSNALNACHIGQWQWQWQWKHIYCHELQQTKCTRNITNDQLFHRKNTLSHKLSESMAKGAGSRRLWVPISVIHYSLLGCDQKQNSAE